MNVRIDRPTLVLRSLAALLVLSACKSSGDGAAGARLDQLEADASARQAQLDATGAKVATLETASTTQQSTNDAQQSRLGELETANTTQETAIAEARTRLAALEAKAGCAADSPLHCDDVTRLYTFNAYDGVTSALNLFTGRAGLVEFDTPGQGSRIANAGSHVRLLTGSNPDALQAGIQGGETGAIVDLGTADELSARHGSPASGWPFGALGVNAARTAVTYGPFSGYPEPAPAIELPEAASLFDGSGTDTRALQAGHLYVGRISSPYDPGYQILFKFIVTKNLPDTEATIRYRVIAASCGSEGTGSCTPTP